MQAPAWLSPAAAAAALAKVGGRAHSANADGSSLVAAGPGGRGGLGAAVGELGGTGWGGAVGDRGGRGARKKRERSAVDYWDGMTDQQVRFWLGLS